MEIQVFKALWGMEGTLANQVARISEAGYAGIEAGLPQESDEAEFRELLKRYNLQYIAMVFTGGPDHYASFEAQVRRAATFHPVHITAHSVKDSMPFEAQADYFRLAVALEKELGLQIGHETHRGRALYNPWETARMLHEVPELKLTADFSHWCCVCESLLEDQEANLEAAFPRVAHIHARVGYSEGPQVPDPRAPEYAMELERHLAWWKRIADTYRKRGETKLTVTPEFGPPRYMHTLPYTDQPVANLWDVCLWMGETFRSRIKG